MKILIVVETMNTGYSAYSRRKFIEENAKFVKNLDV